MYCTHCGKNNKNNSSDVCQYCGEPLIREENLTPEQEHDLSKALHNREHKCRESVDNAMVFVILGSIFLIIGFVFLLLSNKMNQETFQKSITIFCFEFWVSMAGLGSGSVLFVIGIIRLIINLGFRKKEINRTLKKLQYKNYHHLEEDNK